MKIPAPIIPPITAMVVPKSPRWRARLPPGEMRSLEFSRGVTIPGSKSTLVQRSSARSRQFVKVCDMGEGSAVHALHFWVLRFNDVVLIRGMRAVAVAQAKVRCRQAQQITSEHVAGPRTGKARKNHGIDVIFLVNTGGGANHAGISGR